MDEKRRAEKILLAGEKQPSMKRRDDYNDYRGRRMYMITMEVEGRRPVLGHLAGNLHAAADSKEAPHVELSPLGQAVSSEWMGIPRYYPQIEVMGLQVMPDHLHGILFVHEELPLHIGHVLGGFKAGCNRILRSMRMEAGVAAKPQPTQNARALPPQPASTSPELVPAPLTAQPAGTSPEPVPASLTAQPAGAHVLSQAVALPQQKAGKGLFAPGYNDLILKNYDEFKRWKNYLADNPRRLMLKRSKPYWLRPFFGLRIGPYTFSGIGNRALISAHQRIAVRVSRRITGQLLEDEVARYLGQARQGAVLISPAISPGEKKVMRAAFDAGLPTIVIMCNGFSPMSKPRGEQFDACAEGRLLMLSAWEYQNERRQLTAYQCQQMNLMAIELSQAIITEKDQQAWR